MSILSHINWFIILLPLLLFIFFICMSFGLKCGGANQIVNCLVVCCEEKGSGDLGLQGLRQSQSRRCIYIEVIFFSFSCLHFPELIFPLFSLMGTNTFLFYFCYSTASAVTVRSTIRRLREQTESWALALAFSMLTEENDSLDVFDVPLSFKFLMFHPV